MKLFLRASFALSILLSLTIFAVSQSGKYTIQIVAAPTQTEAEETANLLKAKGVDAYVLKSFLPGKGTFYRVRAGSFSNANEARQYGESLKQKGIVPEFFIAPFEAPKNPGSPEKPANKTLALPDKPEAVKSEPAQNTAKPKKEPPAVVANNSPAPEPVKTAPSESAQPESSSVTSAPSPTTGGTAANFAQFRNSQIGFAFDYPAHWTGNPLTPDDAQAQRVNAGAYFQSADDNAFLHVIWNELEKANNPANNNDLIVDVILTSMKSGKETKTMEATSRRVEETKAQIRTYLDLRATFVLPGQTSPLDFLGKALIIRANKGILLTAIFFSKDAPATVPSLADKVIASVKIPE
ncbi:MAG: SPOR domain-containing protein [Acidobacteriota bacterium]|nr:SPOR domain-containing protein [Acidobacteriota bacterium]